MGLIGRIIIDADKKAWQVVDSTLRHYVLADIKGKMLYIPHFTIEHYTLTVSGHRLEDFKQIK